MGAVSVDTHVCREMCMLQPGSEYEIHVRVNECHEKSKIICQGYFTTEWVWKCPEQFYKDEEPT